ncbi:hypothetical protein AF72_04735 [Xylella taiwanensis]|uniref:Uncharacterized protein n=1 Tax=Xylella taiwanensis TaxID=1444770 RepID=Z9JKY6_9GAMM|nr:hypothetical protein AF72_04735 [Xylella taiwanensis]
MNFKPIARPLPLSCEHKLAYNISLILYIFIDQVLDNSVLKIESIGTNESLIDGKKRSDSVEIE